MSFAGVQFVLGAYFVSVSRRVLLMVTYHGCEVSSIDAGLVWLASSLRRCWQRQGLEKVEGRERQVRQDRDFLELLHARALGSTQWKLAINI